MEKLILPTSTTSSIVGSTFCWKLKEIQTFLDNISKCNCAFQLTSFGCNEGTLHGWNPQFRIQGRVCGLIGPRGLPLSAHQHFSRFTLSWVIQQQIRWKDDVEQLIRHEILLDVQETLQTKHLYVRELKATYEFPNTTPDYRLAICESRRPAGIHERTYNASTVNEVAVLMPNDPVGQRDIILHARSNQLQGISVLHRAYDKYV